MRMIDAHDLYDQFLKEMETLVKSTNHKDIDLEAISMLCGAKLITDAQTVTPEPGWISVKDRLPAETHSIFWPLKDTVKWNKAMWKEQSDKVIVAIRFKDGTRVVRTGETHDGEWRTDLSKFLDPVVTHWMPMPEPPKEET